MEDAPTDSILDPRMRTVWSGRIEADAGSTTATWLIAMS
jgi:hypothetical protein